MGDFEFTDPRKTPFVELRSRGELPHLEKDLGSYFVTFRLWDAVVPRRQLPDRLPTDPLQLADLIGGHYDPPLRLGSCALSDPRVAELVQNAFRHFSGQRYNLAAWCVMPNHVHIVFTPLAPHTLSGILHSWKSFTSNRANAILGRTGTLWERESFDHLIRTAGSFDSLVNYVEANPVVTGLCPTPADWLWSSARLRTAGG